MVLGLVLVMTVPSIEEFLVGSYSPNGQQNESQAFKQGIFFNANAYNLTEYKVTEYNDKT